jgi:hypothetical protein
LVAIQFISEGVERKIETNMLLYKNEQVQACCRKRLLFLEIWIITESGIKEAR